MIPVGNLQTGAITVSQLEAVLFLQGSVYNRPYRVDHITAGKIKPGRDLRPSHRFLISLSVHDLIAGQPKLYAADAVDHIVHAGMTGDKTAPQSAVGRIDNSVDFQRGNIPFPEGYTAVSR